MPRASSKEPCDIRLHAPGDRSLGQGAGRHEARAMSWKPERDIEIVAGTPPGGGLDRSDASVYPTDISRVPPHAEITPQRPDWLAGQVGFELAYVISRKSLFEMSRGFPTIQRNLSTRDFSRASRRQCSSQRRGGLHVTACGVRG